MKSAEQESGVNEVLWKDVLFADGFLSRRVFVLFVVVFFSKGNCILCMGTRFSFFDRCFSM